MQSRDSSFSPWMVPSLVFASGFCALVYQVVWTRELRLVFGASTAASAAVVAIFAAGLGCGGLVLGRKVERSADPLAFYARLELAIAALCAATPVLLSVVRRVYVASGGSLALGVVGASAVRLVLASFVLGTPTFLMGGTLPAVARAVETEADAARRGVALLYGLNTLGAVVGCGLTTFALLEIFGARLTLWLACLLNVIVAVVARAAARDLAARPTPSVLRNEPPEASVDSAVLPTWATLASACVVGFAFFLMELVWYRLLGPLLGGTIFTFGLILAVALAGIGVGGMLYTLVLAGRRALLSSFALTCLLEAACIALPYALGDRIALYALLLRPLGQLGFGGLVFGWGLIAGLMVFPAALIAGLQFPILIALLGHGRAQVGRDVGLAYAANTLGAVVGALSGGFGLMAALGAVTCFRLTSLLLCAWGAAAAIWSLRREGLRVPLILAGAALLITLALLSAQGPTAAFRHSPIGVGRVSSTTVDSPNTARAFLAQQRHAITWQAEGVESAVALDRSDGLAFVVNGKSDGNSVTDAPTQVMSGLLGAALQPRVRSALVIGLGTGSTAGWIAALPGVERVDVAEIEPAILEVARRCAAVNEHVLDNPRVHVFRGDARELLAVLPRRYDLIFSEPSNPYRAGIASLYTREFYRSIASRLAPGGRFVQWVQAYEVDSATIQTIYATLGSVFPNVETWNGMQRDLLLIASVGSPHYDASALRARLAEPVYARALRVAWRTEGLEGLLGHYMASSGFARVVLRSAGGVLNTDDLAPVEFGFGRDVGGVSGVIVADSILAAARQRKLDQPPLTGEFDAERVAFERELFSIATGLAPNPNGLSAAYRARLQLMTRWAGGDMEGALALYRKLDPGADAEPSLLERLAVSELLAHAGDPEAEAWLVRLARDSATEAAFLRGVYALQRRDAPAALAAFRYAIVLHRRDPWAFAGTVERALVKLREWAGQNARLAPVVLSLLAPPFAVNANEGARERARFHIALTQGPEQPACLQIFAEMEPNVPWTLPMLRFRAACYAAHGSPLRASAEADVARFTDAAPQAFGELLE